MKEHSLISKNSSKDQYERLLDRDECDAVFNVFDRLRDFTDEEKDVALIIVSEIKMYYLLLQCDCNDNMPALDTIQ